MLMTRNSLHLYLPQSFMKVLTPTRWFAGEEAVKRLRNQWKELIQSLLTIACDM